MNATKSFTLHKFVAVMDKYYIIIISVEGSTLTDIDLPQKIKHLN